MAIVVVTEEVKRKVKTMHDDEQELSMRDAQKLIQQKFVERCATVRELLPNMNFQDMSENPALADYYESLLNRYDIYNIHPRCKSCVQLCKQTECPGLALFYCSNFTNLTSGR